jgi:hypothetical protein
LKQPKNRGLFFDSKALRAGDENKKQWNLGFKMTILGWLLIWPRREEIFFGLLIINYFQCGGCYDLCPV